MGYSDFHLPLLITVAIVILLLNGHKLMGRIRWVLLIYLSGNLLIEILANFAGLAGSNLAMYNFGIIFETSCFLLIYYRSVEGKFRRLIIGSFILFISFAVVNALLIQPAHKLYSNTYILSSTLFMMITLNYLLTYVIKNERLNPLNNFMFWFGVGVLFCYLGNLPYLATFNENWRFKNETNARMQLISLTVNTVLYSLIAIGILCHRPQKILPT